jgi:hypothetical protein
MHKLELKEVLVVGVGAYRQAQGVEVGELGTMEEEEEVALDHWRIQMID